MARCPACRRDLLEGPPATSCPACGASLPGSDGDTLPIAPSGDPHPTPDPDATPALEGPSSAAGIAAALELKEAVGVGGFGTVYRAVDTELEREVAVKYVRRDGEDAEARFELEAVITGNLQHQNIVPVHALGRDARGRRFYAMKILEGRTLDEILAKLEADDPAVVAEFTRPRLLQIFIDVCEAVAFAHSQGVIHRDLKPSNIMLGAFGEVYVMDWGLAKLAAAAEPDSGAGGGGSRDEVVGDAAQRFHTRASHIAFQTVEGSVMGTPGYMSPEQADGKSAAVDARSDVYSLGVILYELLTLHLPVAGSTPENLLSNTSLGMIRPFAAHPRGRTVPRELAAVALTALALAPGDRYPSVRRLAGDVRAHLEDRPVGVYPGGPLHRFGRWSRRHRGLTAATLISLAVVVLAGIAVLAVLSEAARREKNLARQEAENERETARELRERAEAMRLYIKGSKLAERFPALADEAHAALERALAKDPTLYRAHLTRAHLLVKAGRTDEAIAAFEAANAAHREVAGHDNAEALERLASLYYGRLDMDRAKETFARAAAAEPDQPRAQIAGAVFLHLDGDTDAALVRMDEIIARHPGYWEAYHGAAMMLLGAEPGEAFNLSGGPRGVRDAERAVGYLDRAIALQPAYPMLYVNRGMANTMLKRYDACMRDYSLAVTVGPENYNAHLVRIQASYYLEEDATCEESIETMRRLFERYPDEKRTRFYRPRIAYEEARLRVRQRRWRDAAAAIRRGLEAATSERQRRLFDQLQRAVERRR